MDVRNQNRLAELRYVYLFLFFSISLSVNGQLNSGNLTQISEKDGLSSNNVNAVLIDDLGYIWAATYNGLAKYNGYEFEKFYSNPNDSSAIQGMITYSIMQSSDGQIWMGTNPSYIEVYNPSTRTFKHSNYTRLVDSTTDSSPLYGYVVSSICEDENGNIFFGITTGGNETIRSALLYKKANDTTIRLFSTPSGQDIQNVIRIRKDKKGNIWVLNWLGLSRIDPGGKVSNINLLLAKIPRSDNELIMDFDFTSDNQIILLTQFGRVVKIDQQTGGFTVLNNSLTNNDPSKYVLTMIIDKSDHIWIGGRSGVRLYLPETGEVKVFNSGIKKELEQLSVFNFSFDDIGNLYIATVNNGIVRYEDKSVFRSFLGSASDKKTILPGWVNIIYEASDGKLWIHSDAGISVLDESAKVVLSRFDYTVSPILLYTQCFWESKPGEFYFSYGNGELYKFSSTSVRLQKASLPGIPENTIINFHLNDKKGNEWLACRTGLYKRRAKSDRFIKIDLPQGQSNLTSNDITNLIESRHNGIWLVTNNGLFFYNHDNEKIVRYGFDQAKGNIFISQDINSAYEDKNGFVWVGQWQGGIAKLDPVNEKIWSYTIANGLPSMGVQAISGDDKTGMIWISTFNGMCRFDPLKEQFSNYSIEDGIQGSLFADRSVLKTSTGLMIFGGSNGITLFNPSEMKVKNDPPRVFLTDLKLFNKSVLPGPGSVLQKPVYNTDEVVLSHHQNNLSIEFIALHYSNPLKNRYAFQLENFDPEWREVINQRQAFYPKLPPGRYIFRVKAANDKGTWNEEGATLTIIINPPWWQTWWAYCLYCLAFIGMLFLIYRYQKEQVIKKEREKTRAKELEQAKKIEKAYNELRATQQQLIQSEKMASLGELTAGIAHEIQNPLNFVNNFSEVNKELLTELNEELNKGNIDEAKTITKDAIENEEKIIHHGKRADAIVKGMLQHSRSSSGIKEPTDINALCDEYLRLSYHGLRAKDKTFNAEIKTEFDNNIGKINLVPQDIGRVVLNLINNAFYAVSEKAKQNIDGYEPIVTVRTSKNSPPTGEGRGAEIMINVKDNGNGIPESIKEKIFQPFFTTKPTGQGTGLGLSLCYDIVKAHGGEIKVEAKTGTGSDFIISLPEK